MAVDRGGLRYSIFLQDKFTRTSKKFREEMRKNRTAFGQFRASLNKSRADAAKFRSEVNALNRTVSKYESARNRVSRTADSVDKQNLQEARRLNALAKQREAQARNNAKVYQRMRADEAAAAAGQARAQARQLRAARTAFAARQRNLTAQRSITRATKETATAANRVSFTFRRLFGILAAFAAARAGVQGFQNLIKTAVNFNRQIEDSRISLASLIVATGDVRNAQGKLVKGAEAFALAQKEARRQSALLRQDSLQTVATYDELLRAFQAGVGPGLEAGLNLDQVREVTIRVSQAAAALGLQQNQLIEEIRSLLRGTIQARTTIVASVLGISNEDVRQARTAGQLFEFLQSRLEAFKFAADETQKTVTGLLARIRDALGFAAGTAALAFYEQFRLTLKEIFNTLVRVEEITKDGKLLKRIVPNERAVAVMKDLFNALSSGLGALRDGIKQIDFASLTRNFAQVLAAFDATTVADGFRIVQSVITLVSAALVGAAAAARTLVQAFAPFAPLLQSIAPAVALWVQFRTVLAGIKFVAAQLVPILGLFPALLTRIGVALDGVTAKATLLQKATRSIAVIFIALAGIAKVSIRAISGEWLSFTDSINIFLGAFVLGVEEIIHGLKQGFSEISEFLALDLLKVDFTTGLMLVGKKAGIALARGITSGLKSVLGDTVSDFLGISYANDTWEAYMVAVNADIDTLRLKAGKSTASLQSEREEREAAFEKKRLEFAEKFGKALAAGTKGSGFDETIAELKRLQRELGLAGSGVDVSPKDRSGSITSEQRLEIAQLENQTKLNAAKIKQEGDLLSIKQSQLTVDQQAVAVLRVNLDALQTQNAYALEFLDFQIKQQQAVAEAAQGKKEERIEVAKLRALEAKREQEILQFAYQSAEIERERRKAMLIDSGTIGQGMLAGIRGLAEQMGSEFKAGIAIMQSVTTQFASFLSSTIVDAFDPTTDTDLLERIGQFFKQVAQMILQQLIQLAIAKAVLGLGMGSPYAGMGFAEGGEIPDKKAPARVRPKGLDPSDRVPIWAAPGEFMQRASAVRKYGLDVMDKINRGLLDPSALRALAGLGSIRKMKNTGRKGPGFAEGGAIPVAAAAATRQISGERPAVDRSGPSTPVLFFGEREMARALATGGGKAMQRWLRENNYKPK